MNELYAEFKDEAGDPLTSVVVKLSAPDPYDLTDIDLSEYKGIVAPWNNWRAVQAQNAHANFAPDGARRLDYEDRASGRAAKSRIQINDTRPEPWRSLLRGVDLGRGKPQRRRTLPPQVR